MAKAEGGSLTTHVLDTATGQPAAGLTIDLFRIDGTSRAFLKTAVTNDDGRCEGNVARDSGSEGEDRWHFDARADA